MFKLPEIKICFKLIDFIIFLIYMRNRILHFVLFFFIFYEHSNDEIIILFNNFHILRVRYMLRTHNYIFVLK